jgi:diacylglycerol kinase family enzyme
MYPRRIGVGFIRHSAFPIHIDGEYLGRRETPLNLTIIPRVLPVLSLRDGNRPTPAPLEKLL